MKTTAKILLFCGAALGISGTASAQTAPPKPPQIVSITVVPDPGRLAAARRVVAMVFPQGTYDRLFSKSFGPMMEQMTGTMGQMPMREIVRMAGLSESEVGRLGDATIAQVMEIYDPYWQERMQRMTRAISESLAGMMVKVEPIIRDGLARAYAHEFSVGELAEMERFFATPAGKHYAAESMMLFMDPEVMKTMTDFMPKMMKDMPEMIAKAKDAMGDLPASRRNADLTPAERKKLGELLGIDPAKLKDDAPAQDELTTVEVPSS